MASTVKSICASSDDSTIALKEGTSGHLEEPQAMTANKGVLRDGSGPAVLPPSPTSAPYSTDWSSAGTVG